MLDMQTILDTIKELEEDGGNTFDSCLKLASLYIIREYNSPADLNVIHTESKELSDSSPAVLKELEDILPQYGIYKGIKQKYQLKNATKEQVLHCMNNLCKEIKEFLHTLYISTDMPEEREYFNNMLQSIKEVL